MSQKQISCFKQKEIFVANADDRIIKGLSYVFKDIVFKPVSDMADETGSCVIDCLMRNNIDEKGVSLDYFAHRANYLYAKADRNIIVWGGGYRGKLCVKHWGMLYPEMKISGIVDSKLAQEGCVIEGITVDSPSSLINKENKFVVVCVDASEEIYQELEKMGYEGGRDYVSWRTAFDDVSPLLTKTLLASPRHNFVCRRPFGFADIIGTDVYLCCPASVGQISVGDIRERGFLDVWHSTKARIIRLSIINGSYAFCDETFCDRYDLKNYDTSGTTEIFELEEEKYPLDMIIGCDSSCNLSCPSCRQGIIVEPDSELNWKWKCLNRLTSDVRENVKKIWISGSGEPFFSKLYKRLLNDEEFRKRKSISILSNGTLFDETNYEKYVANYDEIDIVLSIDGAARETYEKLRRGGKFEVIKRNLEFLGELRKKGEIQNLQINFVLQASNVSELGAIAQLAASNAVDSIKVIKLYDYHMYGDEMDKDIIVDEQTRSVKEEYRKYFTEDILDDPVFDWSFMAPYLGQRPKKSLFIDGYSLW